MTKTLYSILPDAEALLSLEPEELAGVVLEYLVSLSSDNRGSLNRYNFSLGNTYNEYPPTRHKEIGEALMEAWSWLASEGLIAEAPGQNHEWYFITRRGRKIANRAGLNAYRASSLLPRGTLHPTIAQKCWSPFLRGEYDTAVFQAFKELEVAIRDLGKFKAEDYGVGLARKAFESENGPLTDKSAPKAEREALSNLVSGALGLYKNPHSHRNVQLGSQEAVQMILLASHLLKVAEWHSLI